LSRSGEQASDGRKLVALRQKMPSANPYELGRMRAQAVRLLFRLGNPAAAMDEARLLCGEQPDKAYSWMVFGDACATAGAWRDALEAFLRAAALRREAGQEAEALRTELGPAYRTAEGLGDIATCLGLSSGTGGGLLGRTLHARALRLSGKDSSVPAAPAGSGFLVEGLHVLESCHRGAKPYGLPDIVLGWGASEPEWRWRILAEGMILFREAGLAQNPWKKPLASFEGPVLDPRYREESKLVAALMEKKPAVP